VLPVSRRVHEQISLNMSKFALNSSKKSVFCCLTFLQKKGFQQLNYYLEVFFRSPFSKKKNNSLKAIA